jgi:hypothetical protein
VQLDVHTSAGLEEYQALKNDVFVLLRFGGLMCF